MAENSRPGDPPQQDKAARFRPLFKKYGEMFDIPDNFLAGIASTESSFDPNARNPGSSATGLMQMTRGAWNDMSQGEPGGPFDPTNPEHNIHLAAKYLSTFRDKAGGDLMTMAGMYNQGPNAGEERIRGAAEGPYGQKIKGFMNQNPSDMSEGMFGEHDEIQRAMGEMIARNTDPSDPANQPPSVMDPVRVAGEAAQALSGFDPRFTAQFAAQLTQQLLMQEQAYRLTRQQQLMVLAQTFAPYGQGNAAGLMAGFQQQNANKVQDAMQAVNQGENREQRSYEKDRDRQMRQDLLRDKRWTNLEQQLLKHGVNFPIYDDASEMEARDRIARQNFIDRQSKKRMQDRLMELREQSAETGEELKRALLERYKQTDLNKSPHYQTLMADYRAGLQELNDIRDDIQNADEKDWFEQQPRWEARKQDVEARLREIRNQLLNLIPQSPGVPSPGGQEPPPPPTTDNPVTQEEIDKMMQGI